MPIEFSCPECRKPYRVKDELAGKTAKCACGRRLLIPELLEAAPVAAELTDNSEQSNARAADIPATAASEALPGDTDPTSNAYLQDSPQPTTSWLVDLGKCVAATFVGALVAYWAASRPGRVAALVTAANALMGGAVVGLLAGILLVVADRVKDNMVAGSRVSLPLRLLFGKGALSIFIWIVLAIGGTLAVTLIGLSVEFKDSPPPVREQAHKIEDLLERRSNFTTELKPSGYQSDGKAADPPRGVLDKVYYDSADGRLVAYVTPPPRDGKQHPAILWAHGGFGGIGSWLWEPATADNDQTIAAFRDAGIVVMCPSWRGENDNPGNFEMFYGEVNDLLNAHNYLSSLTYVDPERVYVAGHSTGGTLALLAASTKNDFRAVFSFGGSPDLEEEFAVKSYANTPFNPARKLELYFRSPANFVRTIHHPTFYFEGSESIYTEAAEQMESLARSEGRPFASYIIERGNHFDILRPLTRLVAQQIVNDTSPECNIRITQESANDAYVEYWNGYRRRKREFEWDSAIAVVSPRAIAQFRRNIAELELVDMETGVRLVYKEHGDVDFVQGKIEITEQDITYMQDGLKFVYSKQSGTFPNRFSVDWSDEDGFLIEPLSFPE